MVHQNGLTLTSLGQKVVDHNSTQPQTIIKEAVAFPFRDCGYILMTELGNS